MRSHPLNFPRLLLFRVLPVLLFLGACLWAWRSAEGSLTNLWLTPDQQGARLLARQRYAKAAQHFRDPLWQGTALYRDGQFEAAAAALNDSVAHFDLTETLRELETEMVEAANNLEFEKAALLRDQIKELKRRLSGAEVSGV